MADLTSEGVDMFMVDKILLRTLWSMIYHQKETITLYSLNIFEDTLTRNKFKRSDINIYMAYEASGVNMYRNRGLFRQKYVTLVKYGLLYG